MGIIVLSNRFVDSGILKIKIAAFDVQNHPYAYVHVDVK